MIGCPVHEVSHALACVVFRHKINKIELFSPKPDGQLGCVVHSYNPSNRYQKMGLVFIGLAPLPAGLFCNYILTFAMWPSYDIKEVVFVTSESLRTSGLMTSISDSLQNSVKTHLEFFKSDWKLFFIWALISLSITKNCVPSRADMKGVWSGMFSFSVVLIFIYLLIPTVLINVLDILVYVLVLQIVFIGYIIVIQLCLCLISILLRRVKNV